MNLEHIGNNLWTKTCRGCLTTFQVTADKYNQARDLMLAHFISSNTRTLDDMETNCKSCRSSKVNGRDFSIHRDKLLAAQEGKCGICCKEISFQDRNAYVDHDHATGITRKVLCPRCNMHMTGVDNDEWLAKAIKYRDSYRG